MPLSQKGRGASPTLGAPHQSKGLRELVVCVVVSVALFTWSCQAGDTGPLGLLRDAFQTVTAPVTHLGSVVTAPFRGLGNVFSNLTADQATLTELEARVSELEAENAELQERASSVERLQGLLDLQDANNLQSTGAHVVSGSTDSWSATVTIDKGTSAGITPGMPVTSSHGIIGQVISCGATTSKVRLLTDEASSISAMVQSSRAQGMLSGSASGEVKLELVDTGQDVAVGDVIVTSGLGGVFPKGLPVGEVVSVSSDPSSLYLDVVVDLFADPWTCEEVLVVTSLTEEQRATAEDISEADAQQDSATTSSSTDEDAGSDDAAASE